MWLDQLRSRFQGRRVIVNDPRQLIGNCKVDLSNFPSERLILDVDKLIKNDVFARNSVYQYDQPCDLIVFYANSGIPSVTLIEAKGSPYEAYGHEHKAVAQLVSSFSVLNRAVGDCSIKLPQFHVTGAIVTGSLNSGAWAQSDLLTATREAEIEIKLVPSGFDVYREMFG